MRWSPVPLILAPLSSTGLIRVSLFGLCARENRILILYLLDLLSRECFSRGFHGSIF